LDTRELAAQVLGGLSPSPESGAPEICPLDLGIPKQLRARSAELDAAGLEDVGAVRHLERATGVLLDEQNGDALPVDLLDGPEDLVDHLGRETEGGLVQQQ
jgi:hypothetical protein